MFSQINIQCHTLVLISLLYVCVNNKDSRHDLSIILAYRLLCFASSYLFDNRVCFHLLTEFSSSLLHLVPSSLTQSLHLVAGILWCSLWLLRNILRHCGYKLFTSIIFRSYNQTFSWIELKVYKSHDAWCDVYCFSDSVGSSVFVALLSFCKF